MLRWKIFHWYHICFPEGNKGRHGCYQAGTNKPGPGRKQAAEAVLTWSL